jgi:SAM-dependent methyltransferase
MVISCPICSNNNFNLYISSEDFFLTNEQFDIVICGTCGFKITNPRPKTETLSKYYASPDYISHTNKQKGITNKIYYIVRKFTIASKIRLIRKYKRTGSILDIGCGTGEFLKVIHDKGFTVKGIEPNINARKFAKDQYGIQVIDENEIKKYSNSKFDVITMWHVLEHVYDLDSQISEIQNLLRENGVLVIAVPNSESWDAKHYGKFWAAYDLPRHLYHFDQKSINLLFQKTGFRVVKIQPMFFDSFYISMLSEKYRTGSTAFLKGFLKGFYSNVWAMMNHQNFSSLIFILTPQRIQKEQ